MKTAIRAFPPGVNMRKEGNASRNSVEWSPVENRERRRSKRHRIATGIGAQPHEPRTPMDGRTLSHLPGTADPRRPERDRLARTARGRAQAGRCPARRREHARQRRHQVPDPVDLVARDVLYRRRAGALCSWRIAQGPGRSRHALRDSRSAAVRRLRREHAHLPGGRLVERGSASGDQVHGLAHRRALRPEERFRPRALSDTHAAGPGALAPPHARLRQRRSDARHLLDAGRRGLPVGALPDPARGQVRPRRDARLQRLLSRGHAHPASQLVHAARLRHLALLRGGEAHHRQGLRLSQDSLGPGRPGLTGERAAMPKYETKLSASETVAEGTMAFHFARPADFKFQAGQSMNVSLIDPPETDHKGNSRSFSLVSAPYETELVIATRIRDTAFKRSLKAMPAGGRIHLRGPAGNFTLDRADARPAVFLAGGIGVTPFMSMSRQAAHDRLARDIWLFYSNRRPEDAAFLEELAALPRRNPRYRFVGTMVEMAKSSRPWSGETGFLDRAMLERHLKDLAASVYYAAGPPGLVEAMQKMLADAGVKDEAIRTDEFFGY